MNYRNYIWEKGTHQHDLQKQPEAQTANFPLSVFYFSGERQTRPWSEQMVGEG